MTKKNLTRVLARMAKDGDAETVAEVIGEIIGESLNENPAGETEEKVTVEVPENREITIDEEGLAGLLQRLDRLIALLAAGKTLTAPAGDEEAESPAGGTQEALQQAVQESLQENLQETVQEAVQETMQEVVQGTLEQAAAEAGLETTAEQISEMAEAILGPESAGETESPYKASVTLEEGPGEDCGTDPAAAKDALRAALMTFRPVLRKMSPAERRKACADIAANLRRVRRAGDGRVYAALASARGKSRDLSGLGKTIMAARNANYRNEKSISETK